MCLATFVLGLALAQSVGTAAERGHVSVRATTAAIVITGGAAEVGATLSDARGARLDGLVIERQGGRTSILLVTAVKPGARIEVVVPRLTDLQVEGSNGGPVTVRDVSGQLEIVNSNAAIVLERVSGTVLASTSNGPIEATLDSADPRLPMSFLTSNGRIEVVFPANLKATLRLESDTGPITSEFALAPLDGEPITRSITRGGRRRTLMLGAVNGGGPQIDARTENAPIVIRRHQ